jgi:bifunctional UDP-N-acetylglucosamine pyrophosphorylase/glucosamine-1-phosphate N-acetyltransferase
VGERGRCRIAYDLVVVTPPVAVILAAGQGTRMRSSTPKLLHPLCGRAMIAWPVAAAREAGVGTIVVVDGPDRPLEGALDGQGVIVAIQEQPRGTADAVRAAAAQIGADQTVIVINGDNPLITGEAIRGLLDAHGRLGGTATIGTAILSDPGSYGRVVRARDGTVARVVETKAPGDATEEELQIREINTGVFAFDGGALLAALDEVRADNVQGEHYLPDVLPVLRSEGRTIGAYEIDPLAALGVNDRAGLSEVRAIAQARIHRSHMLAGVTVVDPGTTVIDADVRIGQDTVIAPFSSLHGETTIGARCAIGPLTTMIDGRVGEAATVVHSYVKEAEIGDRVSVGPFAYLRPGTILREGAKAGTFVEIKNSDIGRGTKVPHLSYIGDAEIGEETNIGAGTITANYDGYRKHRTKIGSRVKVSVDTMFVAPVSVGDDTYTGAGSVLTDDVPDGALGIARAHQRNVEGYTERRRQREQGEDGQADGQPDGQPGPGLRGSQSTPQIRR